MRFISANALQYPKIPMLEQALTTVELSKVRLTSIYSLEMKSKGQVAGVKAIEDHVEVFLLRKD